MSDRYLVEVVIDTGQRFQSDTLVGGLAVAAAVDDMRGRAMVVAVTVINIDTGQCVIEPSRNLAAGVRPGELSDQQKRALLAEALGAS